MMVLMMSLQPIGRRQPLIQLKWAVAEALSRAASTAISQTTNKTTVASEATTPETQVNVFL